MFPGVQHCSCALPATFSPNGEGSLAWNTVKSSDKSQHPSSHCESCSTALILITEKARSSKMKTLEQIWVSVTPLLLTLYIFVAIVLYVSLKV